jgi:DNA-binding transcriptional ArsR family regulator
MKPAAMKRTTIMLPEDLRRRALSRAKQKGVSLGELVRDSLDATLPAVSYDAERDPLFEDVIYDGPSPADVSAKHDKYLYDEER